MIKVLIVDDSPVICTMLRRVMEDDSRFSVVGTAHDGSAAVVKNTELQPDLITMDLMMPVMDGIQATKEITKTSSPAIVAFTTEDKADVGFKCLEVGALEVINKPSLAEMSGDYLKQFCDRLAVIAETHRRSRSFKAVARAAAEKAAPSAAAPQKEPKGNYKVLLIGSSTGGPSAVQTVLKGIGPGFPVPILISQHIDDKFDSQFAKWLAETTGLNVELGADGLEAKKGCAYVAPAGSHMCMREDAQGRCMLVLNQDPPLHFLRPAVDKMFECAAQVYGNRIMAVLLTGMGKDGAVGCSEIMEKGGFTIAEDESTCVVFGMPRAAIEKGAACAVLPLGDIAAYVKKYIR